jgi:hypothetical protein
VQLVFGTPLHLDPNRAILFNHVALLLLLLLPPLLGSSFAAADEVTSGL